MSDRYQPLRDAIATRHTSGGLVFGADPDAIVAPLPVPEVGEERQAMIDQLRDQAIELDMLREALGVPYEPHQSLLERMLEAARGRAGSGAAPEPPAQEPMTDEQVAEMHHLDQFGLFCDLDEFGQIVRAVEQFHGIGKGESNEG